MISRAAKGQQGQPGQPRAGLGRFLLLNVGLTRTRVPTATPEDDRGEKAEPRRYALLTLIRQKWGGSATTTENGVY